jgi:hypothetical protein
MASYSFPQLPNNVVTDVFIEPGFAWIGTYGGLTKLNLQNNTWSYYSLPNDSITKIIRDGNGSIWVGTRNGLFKSDNNGASWNTYTSGNTNNIIKPFIYDVEFDGSGRIWISSGYFFAGNYRTFVSYFQNSTLYAFNTSQFSYGFVNDTVSINNIMFTKNLSGNVLFPCRITNQYNIIYEVGNTSNCAIKTANLDRCSPSATQFGFSYEYLPNGYLWQVGRLRFCSQIYDLTNNLVDLSQSLLPSPPSISSSSLCNTTIGRNEFDLNLVRTTILSGGDMHWDLNNGKYEVPKGSGKNSIFASAHWIGGIDAGGQVKVAAQTYRQTGIDYWAGPIDGMSLPLDSSSCQYFDRVYKASRWEIESFKNLWNTGTVNFQSCNNNVPLSILNWPAKDGNYIVGDLAPFVDVDGNGVYNPLTGGDYPEIMGDQTVFKVYNDIGNVHTETGSDPLGFEFQTNTYGYLCDGIFPVFKVLNYTTLYKTKVINKSGQNYNNVYFGWWVDPDLGYYLDDYVGCEVGRNTGFVYNGDADDETAVGYGFNPPIMNVKVLRGPLATPGDGLDNNNNGVVDEAGEWMGMNKFVYYENTNAPTNGNPSGFADFYNYMRGVWRDNQPITYGGDGRNPSAPVCNFMFPGTTDPAFNSSLGPWTEFTAGNVPADRRFLMSSGPFNFNAGDTIVFDYAYIFSRDSLSGGHTNFGLNNTNLDLVQYWFDNNNFPGCTVYSVGMEEDANPGPGLLVYPNPAINELQVSVGNDGPAGMKYEIYNTMGKLVQEGLMQNSTINIDELAPQIYFFRLHGASHSWITRFVKQ